MKLALLSLLSASLAAASPAGNMEKRADTVQGFDISNYQPDFDFAAAKKAGALFGMIKATEGTDYTSPSFNKQYSGATDAGIIRGGYHFALPASSSGAKQAEHFVAHGGGWSDDGKTLPGMLDMEYNPYGDDQCYGLSNADMVSWVKDFVNTYKEKAGRPPMIYTSNSWWTQCTGDATDFSKDCPLVLARYASSAGTVPGGWSTYSFWQNSDAYKYGGDSEIWNGSEASLKKFAKGD